METVNNQQHLCKPNYMTINYLPLGQGFVKGEELCLFCDFVGWL